LNESKLRLKDFHARLIWFQLPLKEGMEGWNKRNRLLKEERTVLIEVHRLSIKYPGVLFGFQPDLIRNPCNAEKAIVFTITSSG